MKIKLMKEKILQVNIIEFITNIKIDKEIKNKKEKIFELYNLISDKKYQSSNYNKLFNICLKNLNNEIENIKINNIKIFKLFLLNLENVEKININIDFKNKPYSILYIKADGIRISYTNNNENIFCDYDLNQIGFAINKIDNLFSKKINNDDIKILDLSINYQNNGFYSYFDDYTLNPIMYNIIFNSFNSNI